MLRRWTARRLTSVARSQACRTTLQPFQCPRACSRPFQSCTARQADITPLRKQLKDIKKQTRGAVNGAQEIPEADKHDRLKDWELTVGIEIHAQLNTSKKLFSSENSLLIELSPVLTVCRCEC